jgi:fatty acid CoA ligase FadD9
MIAIDPYIIYSSSPLAHSSDRTNCWVAMYHGGRIGMPSGDTDTAMASDLRHLRPTMFFAMPRYWNNLFNQYEHSLASFVKEGKSETDALDLYRAMFGGRIVAVGTGGAPITSALLTWIQQLFINTPVFDVYGTMECGGISSNGMIHKFVQVGLRNVPSLGYFTTDQPLPRGEICIKSPLTINGYYKDDQRTTALRTHDGWMLTGDIGSINDRGQLSVIDRKQNTYKLSHGAFISIGKLESIYGNGHPVIQQIALFTDPSRLLYELVLLWQSCESCHMLCFVNRSRGGFYDSRRSSECCMARGIETYNYHRCYWHSHGGWETTCSYYEASLVMWQKVTFYCPSFTIQLLTIYA